MGDAIKPPMAQSGATRINVALTPAVEGLQIRKKLQTKKMNTTIETGKTPAIKLNATTAGNVQYLVC
jgi:hypothetical protein